MRDILDVHAASSDFRDARDQGSPAGQAAAVWVDLDHRGGIWDAAWLPKPTKPALADALWPVLKAKIDDARWSESKPIPAVADVVHATYLLAQESTYGSYVIRAADET